MTTSTHIRFRWLLATMALVLVITGCGLMTISQDARIEEIGGDIARGEDLVRENGCMACHSIPGMSSVGSGYGPNLDGFANQRLIGGSVDNTPNALIAFLMSPQSVIPGSAMPTLELTEEEARDIATWLYTLDD